MNFIVTTRKVGDSKDCIPWTSLAKGPGTWQTSGSWNKNNLCPLFRTAGATPIPGKGFLLSFLTSFLGLLMFKMLIWFKKTLYTSATCALIKNHLHFNVLMWHNLWYLIFDFFLFLQNKMSWWSTPVFWLTLTMWEFDCIEIMVIKEYKLHLNGSWWLTWCCKSISIINKLIKYYFILAN